MKRHRTHPGEGAAGKAAGIHDGGCAGGAPGVMLVDVVGAPGLCVAVDGPELQRDRKGRENREMGRGRGRREREGR